MRFDLPTPDSGIALDERGIDEAHARAQVVCQADRDNAVRDRHGLRPLTKDEYLTEAEYRQAKRTARDLNRKYTR